MLSSRTLVNLSKQVEKILLKTENVDEYGYMSVGEILQELNRHPAWEYVGYLDIKELVNSSAIRRLELSGNKIRMIRHQSPATPALVHKVIPPKTLFYGTSVVGISRVKTFGIRPFKEQYIKLFPDKRMIQVLTHRNSHVAYVEIDALQAHREGIAFYKSDLNTYLAEYVPSDYIKKIT